MPADPAALIQVFDTLWAISGHEATRLDQVYAELVHQPVVTQGHAEAIVYATRQVATAYAAYLTVLADLLQERWPTTWLTTLPQQALGTPIMVSRVLFPYELVTIAATRFHAVPNPVPGWWQTTAALTLRYAEGGWPDQRTIMDVTPLLFAGFATECPVARDALRPALQQLRPAIYRDLLTQVVADATWILSRIAGNVTDAGMPEHG